MISVSAPGKVHLIGEHSVVYGEPAIIATIGMRAHVKAEISEDVELNSINLGKEATFDIEEIREFTKKMNKQWKSCYAIKDFSSLTQHLKEKRLNPLALAVGKSLELLNVPSGISVEINTEIPINAGLGSSSSMAVAVSKAISEAYDKHLTKDEVNKIAYQIERFNHGTPSGGDNSTCCYGGFVWFQKGDENIVNPLKKEIPNKIENFVIVYVKEPEKTTGELVQLVGSLNPEIRSPIIKRLGELTHEMRSALQSKDSGKLKRIINQAQENLIKLGVSIDEIDQLHDEVKKIGGASKLSGAGGGGAMICYHDNLQTLVDLISDLGYTALKTDLGAEGVRIEI
ncbi:MAG: mevalonate kinase [Candidatus Hydrothermarchaeales archaeon]